MVSRFLEWQIEQLLWTITHEITFILHLSEIAMSSLEHIPYRIARKLDVKYVLVIFGGAIGYSSDDINKFQWMDSILQWGRPGSNPTVKTDGHLPVGQKHDNFTIQQTDIESSEKPDIMMLPRRTDVAAMNYRRPILSWMKWQLCQGRLATTGGLLTNGLNRGGLLINQTQEEGTQSNVFIEKNYV